MRTASHADPRGGADGYKRVSPGSPLGSVCASDDGCAKSFDAMHEYIHAKSVRLDVDAQIPPYYPR
ncbi:hypothetical protein L0Z42_07340 [Burkholderia multivorans]|uniref:hypothetical protein n=1 Tax=Burkholderia multivorans TaxID=87883 RepID=UPI00201A142C|nr:hypothetical protein [Burkholderia multivorans]MCO1370385.1 hypothetical protein [Burkholderia multivorans]MCO1459683.1 hypothetical protein [Burkholderia multivorans]MCO1467350.1 hypothetical protein [Burkholderia multivorans]UQO21164.1 hypothetical protein L0Z02_26780 [Burkholderia multivorans]UQO87386.1 hypothetical protein L0Y86_21650 [Burkholderia multivorans]